MLVIQDSGISSELNFITTQYNAVGVHIHLFQLPVAIDQSTLLATLLGAEANFTGYAVQTINSFSIATVAAHVATSVPNPATFTCSAGGGPINTVYGYYITDITDTLLLWAESDPAGPTTIQNMGDTYAVTAKRTHQSLFA